MIVEPSDVAFDFYDALKDEQMCWHLTDQHYCALGIYDPGRAELTRNGPVAAVPETVCIYRREFRDMKTAQEFVMLHSIQKALDKIKGAE